MRPPTCPDLAGLTAAIPLPLAGRLCRSLQVWGGGAVVTVGQDKAPGPLPLGLFPCRIARSSHPIKIQGSKGHARLGAGVCPSPSQVSCPVEASACSYGLVFSGLGARDPVGALRWRGSPQVGIVEAPEVTEPSRLVGESSGGEVRKQQLDTRVRQEPPGGPVSGAGEGRGLKQASEPKGGNWVARGWAPPQQLAPAASPSVQWAVGSPRPAHLLVPFHHCGDPLLSARRDTGSPRPQSWVSLLPAPPPCPI